MCFCFFEAEGGLRIRERALALRMLLYIGAVGTPGRDSWLQEWAGRSFLFQLKDADTQVREQTRHHHGGLQL